MSMTQPPSPGSGSASAEAMVCRPRPVTALTSPVARAGARHQRVDQGRLADAGVADEDADPVRRRRGRARVVQRPVLAVGDHVAGRPAARRSPAASCGGARSDLVRQSSGSSPASYAATRQRSISRGRGSGSASAVTMTSWSALATMTRSNGSSSSAVRRSDGACAARPGRCGPACPSSPDRSPTSATRSPDHDALAAQLAGLHRRHRRGPSTRQVSRPRSTVRTTPSAASSCVGRSFVRGRCPRPGRTRTSSSSGCSPQRRMAGVTPGHAREHPGPQLEEVRAGSWRWSRRSRPGRRARRARGRRRRGHPVVVVRVEDAAVQRPRPDLAGRPRSR